MEQYQNLVRTVLEQGNYKPNRTRVDTISSFSHSYTVDLQDGFPLLTTKKMDGYRWNSLIHELIWYFSGEEHIRNLREETKIWDAWADEDWNLPTAYGRFWRRYPIPGGDDILPGEWWPFPNADWIDHAADHYDVDADVIRNGMQRWINEESDGRQTFDQLQYVIDTLNDDHPYRGPDSRRLIINAWHPANAAVSKLPPCHFTFVFNVQGDRLNLHLTQRSGDIALGIPFNIACYSLIAKIVAQQTGFKPGAFSHTIVDAHIYCGNGDRGTWYGNNLDDLAERVADADDRDDFRDIKDWIQDVAPDGQNDSRGKPYDHVPGLLEQLSREPRERPSIDITDKPIDGLAFDDIQLRDYDSHEGIDFGVAE